MKDKNFLLLVICLLLVIAGVSYSIYNSNSANDSNLYNPIKNEADNTENSNKLVNDTYTLPEYNTYAETAAPLTCSAEQIKYTDWDFCLDKPLTDGIFDVGILINTRQTQVSDDTLNQVLTLAKSKIKELSGIDIKIQEIIRKDISSDSDWYFAEVYMNETKKIPEGLVVLGVKNSNIENNSGGYSVTYCLWDSKTDKTFINEFHSPFLRSLRYDYCFGLSFIDWSSYYHGDSSDKYGNIIYYHASQIVHEIMHFYGENDNYDHYGTPECNRMSYISKADKSLSESEDYMVICPSVYFNLKPRDAGQYCIEEGNACYSNQECCNGAMCCQSKGMTCHYLC